MAFASNRKISILLHVAGWSIIFLLPVYLFSLSNRLDDFYITRVFSRNFVFVILFYLSYFWLIPKFLFGGKSFEYYLLAGIFIIILYFLNEIVNWTILINSSMMTRPPHPHGIGRPDFRLIFRFDIYYYLITSILVCGLSIGLRASQRYNQGEQKRKELEKEKLSSELAFLKNQISPHFFFNTLNNIYSLTEISTKKAQSSILQLSNMMRYLLYESEKGDISLKKEIDFMRNYIELMKLRLPNNIRLTFAFPENCDQIHIPPLLFISFVENAFKHGVGHEESFIDFNINIEGSKIIFTSKNSVTSKTQDLQDSGIGLENIKKRLAILFPGKHLLRISRNGNEFEVYLSVELN